MKLFLDTFGCSSNQATSESISWIVSSIGFELVDVKDKYNAEIYLCNTCTVKYTTEQKILYQIKQFGICNKVVIVTGCMAKIQLEKIKKSNPKTIILPYESIKMITKILLFIKKNYCNNLFSNEKLMLLNEEIKKTKKTFNYLDSYLNIKKIRLNKNIHISQISEGCIFECSYCIVKKAKGELKSFNPKDIFRDIKLAIDEGCTEIWLTSQDNSQYGIDFKKNTKYYGFRLPDLLKLIIKIQGNFKIRIGMMNPTTVSTILNGLLDVFKSEKIYKVLHLPIQSASDNVLLNMNRKHKIIVANEIINMFRFSFPNITIITDIIVGFCYETEIDFQKTINWIQKFKSDKINVSRYSPREKTKAYVFRNLDSRIVSYRNKQIINIINNIKIESKKKYIGKILCVFLSKFTKEGHILGRTLEYRPVLFYNNSLIIGTTIHAKIIDITSGYLIGIFISK